MRTSLATFALALAAPAALLAQATAGDPDTSGAQATPEAEAAPGAESVEILVGGQTQVPRGPGVRVIAHVSEDLRTTTYEATLPLLQAEVLLVQQALAEHGYDAGRFDGLMGPAVRTAIDAVRTGLGLGPCGCLDGPTLASLGIRARVVQTFVGAVSEDSPIEIIRPKRTSARGRRTGAPASPRSPLR